MNFISLIEVEFKKIRRSKILWIFLIATIILWIPSVLNADLNFQMQAEGIAPEYNFLVQGFMGMSWFMFPAIMIVGTVLLNQTERSNGGILKMLSLPVNKVQLCLAKFIVLLSLATFLIVINVGVYYVCAATASHTQNYPLMLSPLFVCKEAGCLLLSAVPMIAFFWLLSVCIRTPIFSIGIGLASIVPSVLMINTKVWFTYPMAYPFYVITSEYSRLAANLPVKQITPLPWLPFAIGFTILCLSVSCLRFGHNEKN